MAAHGLTIARELLSISDPEELVRLARGCLNAPGLDVGASDGGDSYSALYEAAVRRGDAEDVRAAARCLSEELSFLDRYSNLEEAQLRYREHVRVGSRGWHGRAAEWRLRGSKVHLGAKGRAPEFALVEWPSEARLPPEEFLRRLHALKPGMPQLQVYWLQSSGFIPSEVARLFSGNVSEQDRGRP